MTTDTAPSGRTHDRRRHRSVAEWFCLILGPTLILVGLLGFLAEAKFDTSVGGDPGQVDGHDLIIFEVNGWHNLFHILTGLLLLVFAFRRRTARTAALIFGVIYVVTSIVGLIDGQDILGLIPIDKADNVLHILLALAAILVAVLAGRERDPDRQDGRYAAAAGAGAGRGGREAARGEGDGGRGDRAASGEYLPGGRADDVGQVHTGERAATGEFLRGDRPGTGEGPRDR